MGAILDFDHTRCSRSPHMAKALYGVRTPLDPRIESELMTLRARVRELEAEVAALRAAADVERDAALDLGLLTGEDAALDLGLLTTEDPALV
jgi:hypothetical protein